MATNPPGNDLDAGISQPTFSPYKKREDTRTILAYLIVGTVPLIVVAGVIAFVFRLVNPGETKDFVVALLGPVGGISGAVIGFYFGERAASDKARTGP